MRKNIFLYLLLLLIGVILGSYDLLHGLSSEPLDRLIMTDLRLPRLLTAIMAGIALSISGLTMQTLFRNPLAGPYTLGVSGGASLGVALVTMLPLSVARLPFSTITAALAGSILLMTLVLGMARRVRNNASMLIIGLMLSSLAGALVNLIQNYANPDALKLFITWTFGSLDSVGWREMGTLAPLILLGLILSVLLIRPLNGLVLGEDYASSLGIPVQRIRVLIVLAASLLAGSITAYCGPIAFIGVAVPHIARGLFRTANHRLTLPASALIGADILIACDILTNIGSYPLPVSSVSALFGAPVIIWILYSGSSTHR